MSDAAFIELQIVRGRLQAIVDESGAALMRTAFSNIVREAKDFACAILTPDGHTVVQSSQSIPAFLGTMTHTVQAILEQVPPDQWSPGDVIGTNDPWLGTGHLYDLTVVTPVFLDGRVIAFAGVVAHLPDVGGRGQGVDYSQIFEEGLRLPPVRLATADGLDRNLADVIRANVRLPDQVLGDINAMLNAGSVIAIRLSSLCQEITAHTFRHACSELEMRTEEFVRGAIRELPDGRFTARLESEGVAGIPFELCLTVTVAGDELTLDFDGSSGQVEAAINSAMSFTRAYAMLAIKCLLAPEVPLNDGMLRPVTVTAPAASIVNSRYPAAGEARSLVGHFIPTLVFTALAGSAPERVIGESGAPRPGMGIRGTDPVTGEMFAVSVIAAGGFGARASKDGISCVAFPTNTETIPVEMVESTSPLLFEQKELITDSGGPGQWRGGLGQRVSVRSLADGVLAGVRAQWLTRSPRGVASGGSAARARIELNGAQVEQIAGPIRLDSGDVVTVHSPGAGGYGAPELRDEALVRSDVEDGYVSASQAERSYGP